MAMAQVGSTGVGEMFSVPEMGRRLGISRSTAWRLIRTGDVPPYKLGTGATRIAEEDLDAYLRSIRRGGSSVVQRRLEASVSER